ncbi:hypothetical protein [Dyadobacter bucti]|uniref:hypothetical protein n=1 Tax=Dyadobacter bucti TaxID=2572203 RepID=UPI0011094EBE|nr:hypothetical protein [Dyadobacter bucti]
MNDEKVDDEKVNEEIKKWFNVGYQLEKGGRFQQLMKNQPSAEFQKSFTYKALSAGRTEAKKERFMDNFKPKDLDKDREI